MEKIKNAICISGQTRFVSQGFNCLYSNLIKPNNADVFIHAWYNNFSNNKDKSWNTKWSSKDVDSLDIDKKIVDLYKPKDYIIEPQKYDLAPRPYSHYKSLPDAPVNIQFSMFYSIKIANDLKKKYEDNNNFRYDKVVRTRFDAGLLDIIYLNDYNEEYIYFVDVLRFEGVFCDFLFFGSSEKMDIVCKAYEELDNYYHGPVGPLCGENVLRHHLKVNKLNACGIKKSFFLIRDENFSDKSIYGRFWR